MELKARLDLAAAQDLGGHPQVLDPAAGAGPEIAHLHLGAGDVGEIARVRRARRDHHDGFQVGEIDLVHRRIVGIGIGADRVQRDARARQGVVQAGFIRVDDRGDGAGEHGETGDGLPALQGDVLQRLAADLEHLEAAGGGAEHPHDVVEDVARHDAGTEPPREVDARRLRHLDLNALLDEGLQEMAAHADGQRAVGAELGDMAVEMHDEGARRGVAELGRNLMADPFALVDRHALFRAPVAGHLVKLFLLRGHRGHHVVDEEGEALGIDHLVDPEVLLHLAEDDVGVAREVVGDDEIRPRLDLLSGAHPLPAGGPCQDLFRDCGAHRQPPSRP